MLNDVHPFFQLLMPRKVSSVPFTIQEDNDKHFAVTTPAGEVESWVSAKAGWSRDNNGVRAIRPDQVETSRWLDSLYEPLPPGGHSCGCTCHRYGEDRRSRHLLRRQPAG